MEGGMCVVMNWCRTFGLGLSEAPGSLFGTQEHECGGEVSRHGVALSWAYPHTHTHTHTLTQVSSQKHCPE